MTEQKVSQLRCISCGRRIEGDPQYVLFPCPGCGKEQIVRCDHCKQRANKYACTSCNFSGP
ncbi:MAG: DUF1610 domain-containing protein [Nanoarchaeota archaeon]|nr:DUF1610 domain-containing protein [Nanoarchaeota archaeon]